MSSELTKNREPFVHAGDRRAVLCLHGLTGSPFEVKPLAEALAREGMSVAAPLLAGHETPRALAGTTHEDWLASAERAFFALLEASGQGSSGQAAIIGFSMGGLLAVRLAARHPERICALAVMASPLRLNRWQALGIRVLASLPGFIIRTRLGDVAKRGGSDVRDPEMKKRNSGLPVMPLPALRSLLDLGALARAELPRVTAPALIVHGQLDRTVPMADSLDIAATLGSPEVRRLWLANSGHLVGIDFDREILVAALREFLAPHLGKPSPPTM